MGTWGMGPFENDTAADFSHTLDETDASAREAVIRRVLRAAVRAQEHLEEAVAAARLIAARQPTGEPVDDVCGPKEPMPALPDDLRVLAVEALDRVARVLPRRALGRIRRRRALATQHHEPASDP
ncbi:DUF4259 domain-containing protein [Embleya sp. NPDC008237]|uniref:DUF4259 domain-containing protein n=1 Tax=Embleya sp. NPDC008237 TaxID=3363978 RepID=UPI0036E5D182